MNILGKYNEQYSDINFSYIFIDEVISLKIESKNESVVIDIESIQSDRIKSELFRFKIKEEDFLKIIKETFFACESKDPVYQSLNQSVWDSFIKRNGYINNYLEK